MRPEPPFWRRYLRLFGPDPEADVDDEVRHHLELLVEHYRARGLSPADARAEAARRFGDVRAVKDDCGRIGKRRMRTMARAELFDRWLQDARFAVRAFTRAPLFTISVLLTLGLGIGGSTAVFSVVNAALLRPLPYHDPDAVISVWTRYTRESGSEWEWFGVSVPEYRDFRTANRSFAALAAYTMSRVNLADAAQPPDRVLTTLATTDVFAVIGVAPALGRGFLPGEDAPGAPCVVVLSDEFWRARYAGSTSALNQSIRLDGGSCTIVGVMPPGFFFPVQETRLLRPLQLDESPQLASERESHWISVIGRLRDGVTLTEAEAELPPMMSAWRTEYKHHIGHFVVLREFREDLLGDDRRTLLIVLSGVALLLLVICANLASLLLVRSEARRGELGIRVALGAGRGRLVRQLLTESLLLAGAGGILALGIGPLLLKALVQLHPDALPRTSPVVFDARVLLFTLLVSMMAGVLFGLIPALRASALRPQSAASGRLVTWTRQSGRLREAFVVLEIALTLAVVVAAGLLVRSYRQMTAVSLGLDSEQLLAVDISMPGQDNSARARVTQFYQELEARVAAAPGVRGAGLLSVMPMRTPPPSDGFRIEGKPVPEPGQPGIEGGYIQATPGVFEAMRVPLLQGRLFDARDVEGAPLVAVIDQTAANRFWPGEDPIGRRLSYFGPDSAWITIVGVVGPVRYASMREDPRPNVYVPHAQRARAFYTGLNLALLVRQDGPPGPVIRQIREIVSDLDPAVPVTRVTTMNDVIARATGRPRFAAALMSLFGVAALMVGALGVYGVLSYVVQTRTNELGIRMALGAQAPQLRTLVLRQGLLIGLVGVALGTVVALAATRLLGAALFGVSSTDLLTYASVIALLIAACFLASWVPAHRATRIDPLTALRR